MPSLKLNSLKLNSLNSLNSLNLISLNLSEVDYAATLVRVSNQKMLQHHL